MIQRIQTVWLLLITLLAALLTFYPGVNVVGFQYASILSVIYTVESVLLAVLSLAAIFMYKNRLLQIKLCNAALALILLLIATMAALVGVACVGSPDFPKEAADGTVFSCTYGFSFPSVLYPLFMLIFIFLAIRGIKKDEKLVRSADRLR